MTIYPLWINLPGKCRIDPSKLPRVGERGGSWSSSVARTGKPDASALLAGWWIGAGKMGAPMARRLLAAGLSVAVTEPDPDARSALAEAGAKVAADLSVQAGRDIVFSTLPNDAALRERRAGRGWQAGPDRPLARGSIFVEMSTVSPECSAEVAEALEAAGIHYVRAPVSGSTVTAEQGALTVLASGDRQAWDAALPLIRAFSTRQFYLGPGRRGPFHEAGHQHARRRERRDPGRGHVARRERRPEPHGQWSR